MSVIHFRHQSTTRPIGVGVLLLILLAMICGGLFCYMGNHPLMTVTGAIVMAVALLMSPSALKHAFRPVETFVEVSSDRIVWRDWKGMGTGEWTVLFVELRAIESGQGDDLGDYFVLKNGSKIRLTSVFTGIVKELEAAVLQARPEVDMSKFNYRGRIKPGTTP